MISGPVDKLRKTCGWLPAIGLIGAVWAICMGPLLSVASTHGVGRSQVFPVDASLHVWQYWWVHRALELGEPVFRTDMLTWPAELDLTSVWGGHLDLALGLPLVGWLGPLGAANAVLAVLLLSCGLGVYALAHGVTDDHLASAAAGCLYMTCPVVLHEVTDGRAEQLCFGLAALSLLALGRWLARGRRADLVLAIGMLGLATAGYFGTALLLALLLPVMAVGFLPTLRRGEGLPDRPILVRRAAILLGALVVLAVPVLGYASATLQTPWLAWPALDPGGRRAIWLAASETTNSCMAPPVGLAAQARSVGIVLLGLAPLSLVALFRAPRRPGTLLPWWLGSIFLVGMALGPLIGLTEHTRLATPYRWLPYVVPFFMRFHWPYRFALLGGVCLAVLVAVGLAAIRRGGWPVRGLLAFGVVALGMLHSRVVLPVPQIQILPVPTLYEDLGQTGKGALFEVNASALAVYDPYVAQTVHQRPICCLDLPDTIEVKGLDVLREKDEGFAFLSAPRIDHRDGRPAPEALPADLDIGLLSRLGFTQIVLHLPGHARTRREGCNRRYAEDMADGVADTPDWRPPDAGEQEASRRMGPCTAPIWLASALEYKMGQPVASQGMRSGMIEVFAIPTEAPEAGN